jgi:hypothetical protein
MHVFDGPAETSLLFKTILIKISPAFVTYGTHQNDPCTKVSGQSKLIAIVNSTGGIVELVFVERIT